MIPNALQNISWDLQCELNMINSLCPRDAIWCHSLTAPGQWSLFKPGHQTPWYWLNKKVKVLVFYGEGFKPPAPSQRLTRATLNAEIPLGCQDQYMAPNSKYTGGECPPPPQMEGRAPTPKNVFPSFDEHDKLSSERIGVNHHHSRWMPPPPKSK